MNFDDIEPANNAMDKAFRFTGDQWPKAMHKNLGLPGKFEKLLQNDVAPNPKRDMRMDLLMLLAPDGKTLFEEILAGVEHQSVRVDIPKIKQMNNYKDYNKCKYDLPFLSIVVSPYAKEEHENEYKSTKSDILRPIFICIDDEDIEKRLNILKDKSIYNNVDDDIIMNIALISIFVLNNKYKILKELCRILKTSNGIRGKIKDDMVLVLEEMIKYKLKDDKYKVKELLSMIQEEMENAKRGVKIWFEEEFDQIEALHKKELADKNSEIASKDSEIASKDSEIASKDSEIASKNARIAELELILKENGID